ncbi:ATP-dependent RecD-like DNA helicase, partial [Bacteroidota bacterium]
QLRTNLGYDPTRSQEDLIKLLSEFISPGNEMEILLVNGYAGTGKTTIVSSMVRTLDSFGQKYMLLAPTGRAAKVLSAYTGKSAYTVHKKIYRQKTAKDGLGVFVLDRNLMPNTLFVVDEASMIANQEQEMKIFGSGRLLDDLIEYVYSKEGCKLVLLGDTAQLPPVGLDISPALDPSVLASYDLTVHQGFLDEVVRQSLGSGILINATGLRKGAEKGSRKWPQFSEENFEDVRRINGTELIEEISDSYDRHGRGGTIIVTRSNKRANQYNEGIRSKILWREEEIEKGDMIMVVRNNYYWTQDDDDMDFIANGDIAEIQEIKGRQERYGFRFADVILHFPDNNDREIDAKIMLDTILLESASLGHEENRQLYFNVIADYPEIKSKKKKFEIARENPFYNALQVKFAYAVTCHKAQGGQWENVFVDQGYINEDMINREYYRWLYTAVTRATKKLFLINFGDRYFEDA